MANNGSGKWQLAFWVITFICGTWLIGLTTGVVANDRIRQDEDKDIREQVVQVQQESQKHLNDIKVLLAELKTDIKYIKQNGR